MAASEWMLLSLSVTICAMFLLSTDVQGDSQSSKIKTITGNNFRSFSQKPEVTIIYFFKKDSASIQKFLKEYEKSAEFLEIYNVKLAKLNCIYDHSTEVDDYCEKDGTEDNIYAFRGGHELLALPLENTFDVNSIMSNVLQIVLLREVPIIQTLKDRKDFEEENKGKYDIILSYQAAIGTYEHRVLMEVASAYHQKFKFAISTEKPAIGDLVGSGTGESSMLWVLQCALAQPNAPCAQSKVLENLDLVSVARFFKVLDLKLVHDITEDGIYHLFDDYDTHKVFLYYSKAQHKEAAAMAKHIKTTFYGVLGIIMVDVEHPQAAMFGYSNEVKKVPSVSVLLRGTYEPLPMPGDFTALAVEAFIGRILESTLRGMPTIPEEGNYELDESEDKLLASVEKQDDQVAEAVSRLSKVEIDRSHVPALTDVTFGPETAKHPLRIVVFYLTFDARSVAFLRSYVDASHTLAKESLTPLAAVDCFDWTDVCAKNNITSYPTIRVYRQGHAPYDYVGMLGAAPIISLVKLLMTEAPVLLKTHQEGVQFLAGEYPNNLKDVSDVAVLGLFGKDHVTELSAFKEAAVQTHGQTAFGYLASESASQMCSQFNTKLPAVIVHKRHDMWDPHTVHQGPLTTVQIVNFVKKASLPVFPEITPVNFPAYFARKLPFVILFDENIKPGHGAHAQVTEVIKTKQFPNFTFGWMELTRDDGVAGKVLLEYNRHAEPPALFVVNHESGYIYNFGSEAITESVVTTWLQGIITKKVEPWKMLDEGEWKPLNPGYDFLKMIDEENADEDGGEPEMPVQVPKMDLDLRPPSEEEEQKVREMLQWVHLDSTEKDSSKQIHQHSEL